MTLREYLYKYSSQELAEKLGIDIDVINNWKYEKSTPRVHHVRTLVQTSGGALTYESVVNDIAKDQTKGRG